MMSFDSELDRRFDCILAPEHAAMLLKAATHQRPLESSVIGDVIGAMDPADWGLAVENARRRVMGSRAGEETR